MMNIPNPKKALGLLLLSLVLVGPATAQKTSLESLVARLQISLAAKDLEAYLGLFVPALQAQEQDFFGVLFEQLKMEKVTLRPLLSGEAFPLSKPVFVQAFFENSLSAVQETWRIKVEEDEGRWLIADKSVAGDVSTLYKIVMPNERVERAARVEVKHEDISLTFTDALVFYDNIPDLETAMIVIGSLSFKKILQDFGEGDRGKAAEDSPGEAPHPVFLGQEPFDQPQFAPEFVADKGSP